MEKLPTFIKNLQFIFRPNYWLMNDPYSDIWDKKLNELFDKYDFTKIDHYTAFLGNNEIWVANYPYSCFMPPDDGFRMRYRASRLTILRAKRKIGILPKYPEWYIRGIKKFN